MKTVKSPEHTTDFSEQELLKSENVILERYCSAKDSQKPFVTLIKICRRYYKNFIVSAVFCILQLSAILFLPIATSNIIDAVAENSSKTLDVIISNLAIAGFLLLINYPMQRYYRSKRNIAVRALEAALRGAIIAKLQRLTISFNKQMESGRIHSKVMRDVESIKNLIINLHTSLIHIIVNLTTVIAVVLIRGDFIVLIFFVTVAPISIYISRHFKSQIKNTNSEFRIKMEETNSKVVDMVNLIPVTKAHALENVEMKKISAQLGQTAKTGYELDSVMDKFVVSSWITMQVFQLLCLTFNVLLVFYGFMSIGSVTLYQSYFSTFLNSINSLLNLIPTIASGTEAISSIGEILSSMDIENDEDKKNIKSVKGNFEFSDVAFSYPDGDTKILNGLTISVKEGETVAFVGESGSGKSTILNLVTGFYFATEGKVTVDGIDMKELNLKQYRKHIAVVPQKSILFNGTMRENITYGSNNVSNEKLEEIIDSACLRELINSLPQGLDTQIGEQGNLLSGGQCQRISIARALIRNPKIIILDEATSALDTVSERHIQQAIENLSQNKTSFIVAHRLSTIKNADKIAVIKDGKCVEFGSYDELLEKKGEFYKFRQLQV